MDSFRIERKRFLARKPLHGRGVQGDIPNVTLRCDRFALN
jgi:hypothetical protein